MPALITWWSLDLRAVAPNAQSEAVERSGADLLARWAEASRHYHTTTHLVEMFSALEELKGAGELDDRQGSVARLAGWFHDAIYDPGARPGANEAESAALARETLQQLEVGDDDMDAIDRLIRLTTSHDGDLAEPLDAAFHDADLWILSAPQERFDGYCDQVRAEYAHVPDAAYRHGRAAILGPLLYRETIYRTAAALHGWEAPARLNLARELARLGE
jgi:predicted metal-dependent HD superfamily phosphohydrolase